MLRSPAPRRRDAGELLLARWRIGLDSRRRRTAFAGTGHPEQRRHDENATIAILHIVHDGVQRQA